MKFKIEETCGIPDAIFEDEQPPRSYILSAFLEEARTNVQMFIDMIELGESAQNERDVKVTGLTCNSVDINIYSDRITIEHLWLENEDLEQSRTEISLEEAKQLLIDWQIALKKWERMSK